jgi:hypothetical protein
MDPHRFLLIPVHGALPAVEAALAEAPPESPRPEELRQLVEVALVYVTTSSALINYVLLFGFAPRGN